MRSHLHTVSCKVIADLFMIIIINKSNYKLNIKKSA